MQDGGSNNYFFGLRGLLFGMIDGEDMQGSTKIAHDSYRIFVNNDHVGNKVLLAQNEKIDDLEKYLKNKGFENFSTDLIGNEYTIYPSESQLYDMKNTLEVYLNTR
jgi:hypothetical protein